jgi:hypothetical protein
MKSGRARTATQLRTVSGSLAPGSSVTVRENSRPGVSGPEVGRAVSRLEYCSTLQQLPAGGQAGWGHDWLESTTSPDGEAVCCLRQQ